MKRTSRRRNWRGPSGAATATRTSTSSGPPRGTGWPCSPTRPASPRPGSARRTPTWRSASGSIAPRSARAEGWVRADRRRRASGPTPSPTSWAARTSIISSRRCPRAACRSCRWPTTSTRRPGTTRRPAACGISPTAATRPCAWTDRLFTFNTTCFDCHVSQLATNYDLATDTYRTTWAEAGISCESCHGPGGEHIEAMEADVRRAIPRRTSRSSAPRSSATRR